MLVKVRFLGMQLERRAGSENVPANLFVPPRLQVFLAMRHILLPHTHTKPKLQSLPDDISLTLGGESKGGGSEGKEGGLGK